MGLLFNRQKTVVELPVHFNKVTDVDGRTLSSNAGDRIVQLDFQSGNTYDFEHSEEKTFHSNEVITSEYTLFNFLPVNLYQQFHNISNIYFFIIGLFQLWKATSTTNGEASMWYTLAFILFVSATRAALEDLQKHKSDSNRNNYKYKIYSAYLHRDL